ncbi:MAG: DEAD/DEAH box helicase, partial [Paludibacter sp.]|nr:DEAD/DEAH box helicase [Paludibacter sp.]
MKEKLIVCLVEHPSFGYILQPVLTEAAGVDLWTVIEVPSTVSPCFAKLTAREKELVSIYEKYSERALMKAYSREKNVKNFREKLNRKLLELYIRPFIETQHRKIVAIIAELQIEVFHRREIQTKVLHKSEQITFQAQNAKVVFNFKKNNSGDLEYFIQVNDGESVINLQSRFYVVLCDKPAVVIIDKKMLVFEDIDAKKLTPFVSKAFVSVAAATLKSYIEKFVVQCVSKYDVNSDGLDIIELHPAKSAILTLASNLQSVPVLRLNFRYSNRTYFSTATWKGNAKEAFVAERNGQAIIYWFWRDAEWEKQMKSLLIDNGLKMSATGDFYADSATSESTLKWITSNQQVVENFEFTQQKDNNYYFGEINLDFAIDQKQDWFDLRTYVVFGEYKIPFIKFRHHILNNIREYVLPDNTIAILPEEWFSRYSELFHFVKQDAENLRLNKCHFRLLENVATRNFDYHAFSQIEDVPVPKSFNGVLRQYQKKGFSWLVHLYKHSFGACLADDMGLGKTLQTIALLLYVKNQNPIPKKSDSPPQIGVKSLTLFDDLNIEEQHPLPTLGLASLLVMPTSLIFNWKKELHRFAPSLKFCDYSGNKRSAGNFNKCDVILTTYGTLRKDIEILSKFNFQYLVLDESQYVKNPDSHTFKAVKQITAAHKLALTGTPIENSLLDLWAQFNILNESLLGSYETFKKHYVNPIQNMDNGDKHESTKARIAGALTSPLRPFAPSPLNQNEQLFNLITPFILRRTKQEVAPELPPLSQEIIYCPMSDEQHKIYNAERNKLRNMILTDEFWENPKKRSILSLQAITRLRLIANHPNFVENAGKKHESTKARIAALPSPLPPSEPSPICALSGKFEQVINQMETILAENHKVIVFSSFVRHLRLFSDYFDSLGWQYSWLAGTTPAAEREAEINRFMNEKGKVNCFFVSLKAGGVGLNLTAADYVFILDPWWNPAAEMQAISRSHRIGQRKNVMVYR